MSHVSFIVAHNDWLGHDCMWCNLSIVRSSAMRFCILLLYGSHIQHLYTDADTYIFLRNCIHRLHTLTFALFIVYVCNIRGIKSLWTLDWSSIIGPGAFQMFITACEFDASPSFLERSTHTSDPLLPNGTDRCKLVLQTLICAVSMPSSALQNDSLRTHYIKA